MILTLFMPEFGLTRQMVIFVTILNMLHLTVATCILQKSYMAVVVNIPLLMLCIYVQFFIELTIQKKSQALVAT